MTALLSKMISSRKLFLMSMNFKCNLSSCWSVIPITNALCCSCFVDKSIIVKSEFIISVHCNDSCQGNTILFTACMHIKWVYPLDIHMMSCLKGSRDSWNYQEFKCVRHPFTYKTFLCCEDPLKTENICRLLMTFITNHNEKISD